MGAYDLLTARFARIATIDEAAAVLNWDASAVMPPGGSAARGDQLAVLAGLSHTLISEPTLADALAEAESAPPEGEWQRANLRLMRRAHTRATALPSDLVEALSRASSVGEMVWRGARADSDFARVAPYLEEILRLTREQAQALGAILGLGPYDALVDGWQPGIAVANVTPIFDAYVAFMARALPQIEARQAALPPPVRPQGPFPAELQEAICRRVAAQAGLDFDHARLDRSAHPFCGGTPTDVRITTRYDEADYARALMGVVHETGHALYERGLPPAYARQPVGIAAGMAAHESQSLILEMQAGRSDAFLSWLGPQLHQEFGGPAAAYTTENLGRAGRHVARSFIRVDADEVTYPAHVILRFRLEQQLIEGSLQVADLPEAWNQAMRDLLGITPPDDRHGCLQDIHWYSGLFGYFPSYTLGAMAAAQLMAAARRDVPDMDARFAQGDLSGLLNWLRAKVHTMGSLLGFNDLLAAATGKPLDPADFELHLTRRYLAPA
jgi:carboxypeptidase Taq